jgi:hypothetical protein
MGSLVGAGAISSHRPAASASGRNDLPSLRAGLFAGVLDCTSCHDNPNPKGPKGPHASPYLHLLKASYGRETDVAASGSRSDDLCYGCHDRHSILGNQSFPLHAQHVQGLTGIAPVKAANGARPPERVGGGTPMWRPQSLGVKAFGTGYGQPTPCATCHDPHGSRKNTSLIAFDPSVVTRSSAGALEFRRTGIRQGNCTLTCHGHDHVQSGY